MENGPGRIAISPVLVSTLPKRDTPRKTTFWPRSTLFLKFGEDIGLDRPKLREDCQGACSWEGTNNTLAIDMKHRRHHLQRLRHSWNKTIVPIFHENRIRIDTHDRNLEHPVRHRTQAAIDVDRYRPNDSKFRERLRFQESCIQFWSIAS